jgi:hypothetical protein
MACGATSNSNYPDYLKNILNKIAVGNDDNLKACVCSLKSPLTTEGCPAMGADGKIGAFPFCTQESADSKYALWSLEKAMETYWQVRTWSFTGNGVERTYNFPEDGQNTDAPFSTSIENIVSVDGDYNPNTKHENLVCSNAFYINYPGSTYDYTEVEIGFNSGTVRPAKKVGNLYDSSIYGYIVDGNNGYEWSFNENRNPQIGSISILGATLPMNAFFGKGDDDGEFYSEVVYASATLTPTSYWSTLGSNLS